MQPTTETQSFIDFHKLRMDKIQTRSELYDYYREAIVRLEFEERSELSTLYYGRYFELPKEEATPPPT